MTSLVHPLFSPAVFSLIAKEMKHEMKHQVYCLEVLERLREEVRRKRPELFANNLRILHHDNAPAHTALSVWEFLATKQITVLEHPACTPVLAPK